jgi:predicted alpha-1,2-mannosidase
MPYLYNFAGAPWKSQFHARNIMDKLYTDAPDGLCGDEDNGQTSAWYVFSAFGMYPVTPGSNQYVLGSPLFKKISIQLQNGKTFTINAARNSFDNYYILQAKLNNKEYTKNYLEHSDVMMGGTFDLIMSPTPNTKRGIKASDAPFSMTKE